jgi:protein MPE1
MQNMNQKFGNIGDAYDTAPVIKGLDCLVCKRLLRDAVRAPCCGTNFCDNCVFD